MSVEWLIIPFVVMIPSLVVLLVEPHLLTFLVVGGILALLVWSVFAARISVTVGQDTVDVAGPFYRREIPVSEITDVNVRREDEKDHSWLKWPVVGKAATPPGVRISLGGVMGARITTTTGETWTVFLSGRGQADECVAEVRDALG